MSDEDVWLELLVTEALGSIGFSFSLRSPLARRRRWGTLCWTMGLPLQGLVGDGPGPAKGVELGRDESLLSTATRSAHAITWQD